MKKITLLFTLTWAATFGATSGFSQATIGFGNSFSSLVTTNDGLHSGKAAVTAISGFELQLFYQPAPFGSVAPAAIDPYTDQVGNWIPFPQLARILPIPGRFQAGIVTTGNDVAPNGDVWLTVVGWDNYATSLSNAASGVSTRFASSSVWEQSTGDGQTIPAVSISGPYGGFTGMVFNTPEQPSTLALGTLSAAALLLFHRRKQRAGRMANL